MCLATLLACLLVSSTPAPTVHTPRASISAAVQDAARKSGLPSGTYSIVLKNADTGETITAIEADRPMKPASNMKLFSTGTALMTLGTEFLFRTQLLREILPAGDRLTVVGDGDPAFGDPDLLSKMSSTSGLTRYAGKKSRRLVNSLLMRASSTMSATNRIGRVSNIRMAIALKCGD